MSNFAKIGLNNTVLDVQLINNIDSMNSEGVEIEEVGRAYLSSVFKHETWLKTSFNTRGGKHQTGGVPFRKNYAIVGGHYDSTLDAFIPPKPYPSWLLNEDTCLWEAPVAYPDDGKVYRWDEATTAWIAVEEGGE